MKSSKSIVNAYLKNQDWRVKESSSSPYSIGGLNKYSSSEVNKDYWLREVYTEDIAQAYISGHIHIHDLGHLTVYCCGYSLRDILLKGVRGVPNIPTSAPAKHFDAVLNQVANLITVFQNEIAGAVALNSFDTLLAPFIKNDRLDYKAVKQNMQNFIFSINSNSRQGSEPAFSNVTFDLTPPNDLLDEYVIIGGEFASFTYRSCQQEMDMLNKAFYEIMLDGDANHKLFSYPIPTYNIHKRFDWDNPNNKLLWELTGKFGTPYFANYINSDMNPEDSRSMCPLHPSEKVLVMDDYSKRFHVSTVENLYRGNKKDKEYTVIHKGQTKKARLNKFEGLDFYEITFSNGIKIKFSGNHQNLTFDGIKTTEQLTTEDYLPFNLDAFEGSGLTYEDGLMVGAFLGDGSLKDETTVVYSLNRTTKVALMNEIIELAEQKYGCKVLITDLEGNCTNISLSSKYLRGLIEEFVKGKALDKELNVAAINMSLSFRQGIIDGYQRTDGGNRNRIYTSSKKMIETFGAVLASTGTPYKVSVDNRGADKTFSDNPVYTIKLYVRETPYANVFKFKDNYMWFKIEEIRKLEERGIGYCFEVLNDEEPYFMLPSGLVTHNCRLRLDLRELRKRNGGLFGSGDSTGSIGVVTVNLPRIAYESEGDEEQFFKKLDYYLDIAKKSLVMKRAWLQENILDTGAIPAFKEYVGTLNNHFSTIGIVGMNEMCENFFEDHANIISEKGKAFAEKVGDYIRNKLIQYQEETGTLFNYEATPAESTCYRLALRDRKDYEDIITQGEGKDCYYTNSCHIPVKYITGIDSTFKHQEKLQTQFTGGTVIHCYMQGAISGDNAKEIVKSMFTRYQEPYMSISPISRYCDDHGYITDIVDKCPICKKKLKKYQRITGYLRCVDNFNRGKRAEFEDRAQLDATKIED